MKSLQTKKKGFTLVELLVVLAIIGLLAAIGIPAILNAQRASRNTTRLKQLEAVRNAMADYYTKYNNDNVTVCSTTVCGAGASGSTVYIGLSTSDTKRIQVDSPSTNPYTFTMVTSCTGSASSSSTINFYKNSTGGVVMCNEGQGEEVLTYRQ